MSRVAALAKALAIARHGLTSDEIMILQLGLVFQDAVRKAGISNFGDLAFCELWGLLFEKPMPGILGRDYLGLDPRWTDERKGAA